MDWNKILIGIVVLFVLYTIYNAPELTASALAAGWRLLGGFVESLGDVINSL